MDAGGGIRMDTDTEGDNSRKSPALGYGKWKVFIRSAYGKAVRERSHQYERKKSLRKRAFEGVHSIRTADQG